ncbi:hypothetical protein FQ707_04520 [Bacteroidaceae bacterium HV4-6-C5C]|nr:hypothetical protein FQ707_04520 [Bacteroidaceae bacterium HV4-6-C5C]
MKTSICLLAALGGALLASCSSDSITPQPEPGQNQTARIEVTLTGNNTGTKANGSALPGDDNTGEQKVNNIVIGIFKDSDGSIVTIQDMTAPKVGTGDANKNVITCPLTGTSAVTCSAVVVANVPASSITTLKSSTTKTDFLGQTISLSESTVSGNVQISTNLPMSGDILDTGNSNASTFSLTPGGTKTGLSVQLTRMASRITLTSLKSDFSASAYPSAKFKLQRVLLRGAIATTKVTTSATATNAMPASPSYLIGGGTWSGTAWPGDNPYLFDDLGTPLLIDGSTTLPGSKYYWFYSFANDGSTNPTAFIIQGIFDVDGNFDTPGDATTVFYPVIVNKNQPGTSYSGGATTGTATGSISRNTLYNLAVTLKNKGISSPMDNINPANLEINVSVAAWPAAIVQTVDFN